MGPVHETVLRPTRGADKPYFAVCSRERASQFIATFVKQPEGMPEISRGLSEAASDTHGSIRNDHDPGGVVESAASRRNLTPLPGCWALGQHTGGVTRMQRVQPPANFWQTSGLQDGPAEK